MEIPDTLFGRRLARLVVKDGVGLGGLARGDQMLALAVVWASLPPGLDTHEPGINQQLKAALAGVAVWLALDHVELRRWLVDTGWLWRDGFGRQYRRVGPDALAGPARELAAALAAFDIAPWVAAQRSANRAARAARRQRWLAAPGPAA